MTGAAPPSPHPARAADSPSAPVASRAPAPRLVLASASPRRRQLLEEAGIPFDVAESGVEDDDARRASATPAAWAMALACLKATAAAERLRDRGVGLDPDDPVLVLGADTVVIKDGLLIGKARDEGDAAHILTTLRDGEHDVITGVALIDPARARPRECFADRARVRLGPLTDAAIADYLDSGLWRGKAGAYNLFERRDAGWPISFPPSTDPTTIVGLPMLRLLPRLRAAGIGPRA